MAQVDPAATARFRELGARFISEYPALSPVGATELGDHRFDHLLDDLAPESLEQQREFFIRWLQQIEGIDREVLERQDQVDRALLVRFLKKRLWELDRLQEYRWNPILYTQLIGGSIYGLMSREFAPVPDRLRSVTARLEQFPRCLAQVREILIPARVPPVHAETAVKQNRGVLSILRNMVEPQLAELSEAEQQRLRKAIETARAAIEEHQLWLEQQLLPQARGDFRLGLELFDEKLEHALSGALTRAEVRERAEAALRRVRAEMYEIARSVLGMENWPAVPNAEQQQQAITAALERVHQDLPPRDGIVTAAERSMELTTEFVKSRDLITLPPDPLRIIVMPEFQRGVSVAYCDSPGPLEVGQQTYYAVAPLPEDWTDEQCDSFLREYNIRSIHNLTIHEAMPGHFVQLCFANRYPSVLRAVLASGTFIEGWACYAERMCIQEGFLADDPLMQLVVRKWQLRGIANALLDQGIHVHGMNREQAMQLMIHDTFQEEREAAGKWVRAQVTSAQLSTYFVGEQEHDDLRAAAEAAWGNEFSLKRYHDAVISHGSPPVRFVKALLLNEPIGD
jgi:uncharacterized protein (DUF885 family)